MFDLDGDDDLLDDEDGDANADNRFDSVVLKAVVPDEDEGSGELSFEGKFEIELHLDDTRDDTSDGISDDGMYTGNGGSLKLLVTVVVPFLSFVLTFTVFVGFSLHAGVMYIISSSIDAIDDEFINLPATLFISRSSIFIVSARHLSIGDGEALAVVLVLIVENGL